jgi:hypothetical protein
MLKHACVRASVFVSVIKEKGVILICDSVQVEYNCRNRQSDIGLKNKG